MKLSEIEIKKKAPVAIYANEYPRILTPPLAFLHNQFIKRNDYYYCLLAIFLLNNAAFFLELFYINVFIFIRCFIVRFFLLAKRREKLAFRFGWLCLQFSFFFCLCVSRHHFDLPISLSRIAIFIETPHKRKRTRRTHARKGIFSYYYF